MTDGWGDAEEWDQIESRLDAVLHGDVESLLDESLTALRSLQDEDEAAEHEASAGRGVRRTSTGGRDGRWTEPENDFDPNSELAQVLDNLHRMGDDPTLPAHPVSAFPTTPKPTTWTPVSGATPIGYGKTPDISGAVLGIGDTAGRQPSAEGLERLEAATGASVEDPPGEAIVDEPGDDFELPPLPTFNLMEPDVDEKTPAVEESATSGSTGGVFDRAISSSTEVVPSTPVVAAEKPKTGAFGRAVDPGDGASAPRSQPPSAPGLTDPRTFGLPRTAASGSNPPTNDNAAAAATQPAAAPAKKPFSRSTKPKTPDVATDGVAAAASTVGTPAEKAAGADVQRRWSIGRRRSKAKSAEASDGSGSQMPLSRIVPVEAKPQVTTNRPPNASDGPAASTPLPAGAVPNLKPKVARPKNKTEDDTIDKSAPTGAVPSNTPARKNPRAAASTKGMPTKAASTKGMPTKAASTKGMPTKAASTKGMPTKGMPTTPAAIKDGATKAGPPSAATAKAPADQSPRVGLPAAKPTEPAVPPAAAKPTEPAAPPDVAKTATPPPKERTAPKAKPVPKQPAKRPSTQAAPTKPQPAPPAAAAPRRTKPSAPAPATPDSEKTAVAAAKTPTTETLASAAPARPEVDPEASTLARFAAAAAPKGGSVDTQAPDFTATSDVFSRRDRTRTPTVAAPERPSDLFTIKKQARTMPPSERGERVRGRSPSTIDLRGDSQHELAESLETPRRGLGFLAGLLLLIIGLAAVGYALIANAGGGDETEPGGSSVDSSELEPIDPHTVDVKIDACDEVGVAGTLTNSIDQFVFTTVHVRFVRGSDGVVFHNGTLRGIEIEPTSTAQYSFKYVEDLVPAELQGQAYECSVEVQSVSTPG